ncbi:MAG TPA: tetratricopeptide repeat protein [Gemmatimonadales bacterium]|nr:tetratricopeptide repeat protein [Gemmatimonadales bacterium]
MNFEKLKETARKYEQKEEWRRAIEVYLQAIREFEAGNDPVPDLSVYNRIGDLYLKATEPALAVQAYERAADLYGEQGFYNNAIALCGKILRVNPGRIQTYLKLAHLHARKNVVIEAKKNLLEYLERMNAMNQLDDAFKALKDFADQFPGNKDIRLMLSELLRASSRNAEAKEQLEKLANDLEARGDTAGARKTLMRLQALESADPASGAGGDAPRAPQSAPRRGGGDLVFLDTGADIPRMPAPKAAPAAAPPITRKTRAVVASPEPIVPETVEAPAASLPLIDTGTAKQPEVESIIEPVSPGADLPSAVIDDSPLEIETASLVDTPLELESLQPISDEALVELSGASEVPQALGFEPTELDTGAGADIAPLEGLELDAPASEPVDLRVSSEGLDLERASVDPAELDAGARSSLIVPEPVEPPGMVESEPALPAEEVTGDIDLYDADGNEIDPLPAEPEFLSLETDNADNLALIDEPGDEAVAADLMVEEPVAPEEEAVEFVSLDDEEGVVMVPGDDLPSPEEMPRLSAPDLSIEEPLPSGGPSISELEDRVLEDPDDPEAHRALGEALLAEGDQIRGQEELELALAGYEQREDWQHAGDLINELIRLDPNGVRYHQKRVEIGFRSGDRSRLIDSYLELADALLRVGAMDKALAVYRRVAEHDPGNQRAHAALDALAGPEDDMPMIPPPPEAAAPKAPPAPPVDDRSRHKSAPVTKVRDEPTGGDFIDLGALVMDDEAVKDTRMRVDDEEPTGDEQKDFQDMLSAFKRGIDENIDAEDYQAHYDLGVAFKEMGLLDEAIAEFQKALRSPEGRLKTSEALGTSFYEKGQYAIAEAILKRAVESLGATDDEQIGLIYWLSRAQEEQNKVDAAIANFERVLAVDIGFADVSARIGRLTAGRGK